MNYYLDTEFIECAKQRTFLGFKIGPPVPTIDLISIGIVASDGREYFAINSECELEYAWANEWVRDNVLGKIYSQHYSGDQKLYFPFTLTTMRRLFVAEGKTKHDIATDIATFCGANFHYQAPCAGCGYFEVTGEKPHFFGYYCDYDWVVFAQLFGRMLDLPKGFPMFCIDLKQEMDRLSFPKDKKPLELNEHDALADARWNKQLHLALQIFSSQRQPLFTA